MTKDEFRIELERRQRERAFHSMSPGTYIQVSLEIAFEIMAERMVEAGLLKD